MLFRSHQVTADQVGRQRAERYDGAGAQPYAKTPARQRAKAGANTYGKDRDHGAILAIKPRAIYAPWERPGESWAISKNGLTMRRLPRISWLC